MIKGRIADWLHAQFFTLFKENSVSQSLQDHMMRKTVPIYKLTAGIKNNKSELTVAKTWPKIWTHISLSAAMSL